MDVGTLKADVGTLKSDVGTIKSDVGAQKVDVSTLKGDAYERRMRERAPAILSRVAGGVRRLRLFSTSHLADRLDDAVEAGRLSDAQRDDVLQADAVLSAVSRQSGQAVHLLIEASVTLGEGDVARARRRASLLAAALETESVGVVVTARSPDKVTTSGVEVIVFGFSEERGAA